MKTLLTLILSSSIFLCASIHSQTKEEILNFKSSNNKNEIELKRILEIKDHGFALILKESNQLIVYRYDNELNLLWRTELDKYEKAVIPYQPDYYNKIISSPNGENIYLSDDKPKSIIHINKEGIAKEIKFETPRFFLQFNIFADNNNLNILFRKPKAGQGPSQHSKKKRESVKWITIDHSLEQKIYDILMPVPENMRHYMDYWLPKYALGDTMIMTRHCSSKEKGDYKELLSLSKNGEYKLVKLFLPTTYSPKKNKSIYASSKYVVDEKKQELYLFYVFDNNEKMQLVNYNISDGKIIWKKEYNLIKKVESRLYGLSILNDEVIVCQFIEPGKSGIQSYLVSSKNGELIESDQKDYKLNPTSHPSRLLDIDYSETIMYPNGKAKNMLAIKSISPENTRALEYTLFYYFPANGGEIICFITHARKPSYQHIKDVSKVQMYYYKH